MKAASDSAALRGGQFVQGNADVDSSEGFGKRSADQVVSEGREYHS